MRHSEVLLLDDGELDDVQAALQHLGVGYGRVRGGAIVPETPAPSKLLVTTPRRIDAVRLPKPGTPEAAGLVRIVVVGEDSPTLRARLREVGFDYLVRRPVHPEALRLLLLHCLYTGEERRREPRVPMGFEASFRTGLLTRKATLADLSTRGCRLLGKWPLEPGKRISVTIPCRTESGDSLSLKGRVVRMSLDERLGDETPYSAAVAFDSPSPEVRHELEWILEERARGPATLGEDPAEPVSAEPVAEQPPRALDPPETRADDLTRDIDVEVDVRMEGTLADHILGSAPEEEEVPTPSAQEDPAETAPFVPSPVQAPPEPEPEPAPPEPVETSEPPSTAFPGDRRSAPRGAYMRRVPAFGDRAMRVLVGRDLSMGGMRVEHSTGLNLGERVHLAIYGSPDEEPFLIWATVTRDDGSDGMALVFDEVHPVIARQLEKVVGGLPAVESLHDDETRAMGTVVSEILPS